MVQNMAARRDDRAFDRARAARRQQARIRNRLRPAAPPVHSSPTAWKPTPNSRTRALAKALTCLGFRGSEAGIAQQILSAHSLVGIDLGRAVSHDGDDRHNDGGDRGEQRNRPGGRIHDRKTSGVGQRPGRSDADRAGRRHLRPTVHANQQHGLEDQRTPELAAAVPLHGVAINALIAADPQAWAQSFALRTIAPAGQLRFVLSAATRAVVMSGLATFGEWRVSRPLAAGNSSLDASRRKIVGPPARSVPATPSERVGHERSCPRAEAGTRADAGRFG